MQVLTAFVVVFSIFNCVITLKIKSCDSQHPDFNQCISKSAEDVLQQLKNPIPEIGMPSLEALKFTNLVLPPMSGAEMTVVEGHLDYLVVHGLTDGRFLNFNVNLNTKTIHFEYLMYNLTLKSLMKFKGTLYSKEFNLKERLTESYHNTIFNITLKYDRYEKNDDTFYKIVDSKLLWTPGTITIYLEEENRSKQMKDVSLGLKEHISEFIVNTDEAWDTIFKDILVDYFGAVFSKIPIEKMFG